MSYIVEILNLGKTPVADVRASSAVFDDHDDAEQQLCLAVGELVMRPGLSLLGTDRAMDLGEDGILASARLTHEAAGGRVEVILRRRAD